MRIAMTASHKKATLRGSYSRNASVSTNLWAQSLSPKKYIGNN